ncbi:MAG: hypothetical protein HQL53_08570 [Magnetococcales bacterium]|nr:hypothetical protein [Magnetococcales bacterium]
MMGARIAKPVMDLLLNLCEAPRCRIDGAQIADHFPDLHGNAIFNGAFQQGPTQTVVPDRTRHDGECVEAIWDSESRSHRYFGGRPGRWITVPSEDLVTYDLKMAWLLEWVAHQFQQELRSPPTMLVENHLWDLGVTRVGHRKAGLFFVRRLNFAEVCDRVVDALRTRSGHPPGILLTTAHRGVRNVRFPGDHRVVGLRDCLSRTHVSAQVDLDRVAVLLGEKGMDDAERPVEWSQDYGWIKINGQEFTFKGDKQKRLMKRLIRAWEQGSPRLRTADVLESVDSSSLSLAKFFGKRKDWKGLIEYGGGYCALKV